MCSERRERRERGQGEERKEREGQWAGRERRKKGTERGRGAMYVYNDYPSK